jgi:O-antigen/teichoic acid export membrane protein
MTKFSTNVFYSFLAEISLFALSFLLGVITARYLGADGKGRFWLVFNVAGILPLLFSMRFQRSVTYHLSRDTGMLGEILLYGLLVGAGTTAGITVLMAVFPDLFNNVLLKNINVYWFVLLLLCMSRYLWSFLVALIEGLQQFKLKLIFMAGTYGLKILAVIVALALFNLSFEGLLLFMGLTEGIVYLLILLAVMASVRNYHLNLVRFVAMLKYSAKSYPGMISDLVTLRIDTFFLNFFSGPASVGVYTVAVSLASIISYLPTAARNVLLPFVASYADTQITSRLSRLMIIFMSLIAILLIPFVWAMVVPVYGAEFAPARSLFLILLPGMICWGVFTLLSSDIEGRGFPLQISMISVVGALAAITLDWLLIPIWHATGAAVVSSLTYAFSMLLAARLYRHLLGVQMNKVLLPRLADLRFFAEVTNSLVFKLRSSFSGSGSSVL